MDRYHIDIDPISKTQLSVFYDDPEQFRRIYIDESLPRPEVGRAGLIGKVVHGWLLEQRPLSEMVVRIPDDCLSSNGSIVRARLDAFLGSSALMPVKADVYAELEHAIAEWGPQLHVMFDGGESAVAFEHTVDATVDGVRVKCRPDVWVTRGPLHRLHDIKVSDRIDDRSFSRSAREYKYWMQDAHYCGVIGAAYGVDPLEIPFEFWTLETVAPYRVHVREYDPISRQKANEEWRAILEEYAAAKESGIFEHRRSSTISVRDWELRLTSEAEVTWTEAA